MLPASIQAAVRVEFPERATPDLPTQLNRFSLAPSKQAELAYATLWTAEANLAISANPFMSMAVAGKRASAVRDCCISAALDSVPASIAATAKAEELIAPLLAIEKLPDELRYSLGSTISLTWVRFLCAHLTSGTCH